MLLYLSPALMDWMVFFVSFAVFYAAGACGVGMAEWASLGVAGHSGPAAENHLIDPEALGLRPEAPGDELLQTLAERLPAAIARL